ncbi:hypothetical protein VHEMI09700 [[Torrubiella] hemipterigena]|uniref:Gag-like protein n=1 Tax=[Torrubiella] hemipterigena TaxID=1531966 RepID=A0A0A1TQK2_9HYPO|nr:hypothetical protein VHEMI09700 [[Torrubiella] hemipterigena]
MGPPRSRAGSAAGALSQSVFSPTKRASQGNSPKKARARAEAATDPTKEKVLSYISTLKTKLLRLVGDTNKPEAVDAIDTFARTSLGSLDYHPLHGATADPTFTRDVIREVVKETLLQSKSQPTWAQVASTTKPSTTDKTNTKALNKAEPYEVTVRVANCLEATRRRSSHDTIQRANSVLRNNTVIAARTLPSGDVRLTFAAAAVSSQIDEAWLLHVFGTGATRLRTEHAVIVRGVPPAVINPDFDIHGVAAQNVISFQRVIPARARPGATKRSFIMYVTDIETANKLCDRGFGIDGQLFDYEPYTAAARPLQCYNYFQFGHQSRQCAKPAICGSCSGDHHGFVEGTKRSLPCPSTAPKCPNCNKDHPAWARSCRVADREWERARAAYSTRPRRFQDAPVANLPPPPPPTVIYMHPDDTPGPDRKRQRGRPRKSLPPPPDQQDQLLPGHPQPAVRVLPGPGGHPEESYGASPRASSHPRPDDRHNHARLTRCLVFLAGIHRTAQPISTSHSIALRPSTSSLSRSRPGPVTSPRRPF